MDRRIAALRPEQLTGPYTLTLRLGGPRNAALDTARAAAQKLAVGDVRAEAVALALAVQALIDAGDPTAGPAHAAAGIYDSPLPARCRAGAIIALHARALSAASPTVEGELDADLVRANVHVNLSATDIAAACAICRAVDR